jgi:tetratricopeptide (TPR) repeat protein
MQTDDLEESVKCFSKAIELRPNWAEAYYNRGVAYDRLAATPVRGVFDASSEHSRKCWQSAIRDLTKAISLKPDMAPAYEARGWVYKGIDETKKALKDFQRYLDFDAESPRAQELQRVVKSMQG